MTHFEWWWGDNSESLDSSLVQTAEVNATAKTLPEPSQAWDESQSLCKGHPPTPPPPFKKKYFNKPSKFNWIRDVNLLKYTALKFGKCFFDGAVVLRCGQGRRIVWRCKAQWLLLSRSTHHIYGLFKICSIKVWNVSNNSACNYSIFCKLQHRREQLIQASIFFKYLTDAYS